jgi:hypothetical protein
MTKNLDFVDLFLVKLVEPKQNNLCVQRKFLVVFLFGFSFKQQVLFLVDVSVLVINSQKGR